MLLETEKESVCVNQIVGQKKEEAIVEGDVIVNDIKPDVLNIISATGIPCVYKKEIMEGKIRIDGSINTYIIYLADDENSTVRSLNTVLDFTQVFDIDGAETGMIINEQLNVLNFECRILNSRKINIKAILEIEAKIYSNDNVEIISNISNLNDIQTLNNNRVVNSLAGSGNTRVYAKDTISIDNVDDLAEIMRADIKIVDKDIKLSYNKVLAKADASVKILYLTEDNRIKSVDTKIPIMGFVDIENINDDDICDVDYKLKNLIIKPNNADAHTIYIEAEIEIICFAYETKTINLIEDLYSISSDLSFKQKQITAMAGKQNIKEICEINEKVNIPDLGNNQLYDVCIRPQITTTTLKNGKVIYEGQINMEFLYETLSGMESRKIELPFNYNVESDGIDEVCSLETTLDTKRDDFILNNDGNIEAKIEFEFNIAISKNENINIINEISMEDSRQNNIYSMVIYFVKQGDTLWQIAKKFKSTIEDIARVNNIEDINKIYTGQQLYIPKFVKKSVAV